HRLPDRHAVAAGASERRRDYGVATFFGSRAVPCRVRMIARWRSALAELAQPLVRTMLLLGFASGLPFPLVLTTLSVRLRQSGIDRTTIGYFSLVGLAYSLKFWWSPVVDRVPLPLLRVLG